MLKNSKNFCWCARWMCSKGYHIFIYSVFPNVSCPFFTSLLFQMKIPAYTLLLVCVVKDSAQADSSKKSSKNVTSIWTHYILILFLHSESYCKKYKLFCSSLYFLICNMHIFLYCLKCNTFFAIRISYSTCLQLLQNGSNFFE